MSALKLLFIGDIVGESGLSLVESILPGLLKKHQIDFCVANGENSHEGRGINEQIVKRLYKAGVQVITGGDHSFDKHLIIPYMRHDRHLLRPLNYPKGVAGFGYVVAEDHAGRKIAVLNLRGLAFFQNPIECPFRTADWVLPRIQEETNIIFVDFHAEATAEKVGMGHHLNGRVSAMAGTHTHIPTADEQILSKGTGYITDVGFTGPHDSVIGMDKDTAMNRFMYQTPQKYKIAEEGNRLNGVIFTIDVESGQCTEVQRLHFPDYDRTRPVSSSQENAE
jgi:metallophosphoesterase (TIGR00282 family)